MWGQYSPRRVGHYPVGSLSQPFREGADTPVREIVGRATKALIIILPNPNPTIDGQGRLKRWPPMSRSAVGHFQLWTKTWRHSFAPQVPCLGVPPV